MEIVPDVNSLTNGSISSGSKQITSAFEGAIVPRIFPSASNFSKEPLTTSVETLILSASSLN